MANGGQGLDDLLAMAEVARLRDVLEDRDDAVLALADEGYAILWATGPGSRGMFGREDEQYQGMDARQFIHPAEVPDWERAFARALAGETVRWEGNVLRGDGAWVRVSSVMWRTQASRKVLGVTRPADEPFGH